ncbi:proton-coupled amino acid transporter-like protein CG1139 isoform X2 [Atheta coriaria]
MSTSMTNPAYEPDEGEKKNSRGMKDAAFVLSIKDANGKDNTSDKYDPYQHRKVEHPTTNSETLFHLLKGSLGTGILAMPLAFSHSGYIIGLIGTVLIGLICTYCIHLLISAEYELCKRRREPSLTYPATAEAAFLEGPAIFQKCASASVHMVNAFLLLYQMGTCCVYIVFIATNIKNVCDEYFEDINLRLYMLMFLLPLILINWIKNLKLLAPFSTAANFITFVSFGIIVYYLIDGSPTFEERDAVGDVENWPLFLGTVLFALEAIGVIMPLENEMKTPKKFGGGFGVLNIGMSSIVALYMGMGFLGYLTYGNKVKGSITLDLPPGDVLGQVVQVMLALSIFITYALQCYVAIDITWNEYLSHRFLKNSKKSFIEYVVRTLIVLITFSLAAAYPKLDLFISLIGALCLAALGIAIPALIDMCTYWNYLDGMKFNIMVVKNVLLICFGIFGLVIGTYTSLSKIIDEFVNGEE